MKYFRELFLPHSTKTALHIAVCLPMNAGSKGDHKGERPKPPEVLLVSSHHDLIQSADQVACLIHQVDSDDTEEQHGSNLDKPFTPFPTNAPSLRHQNSPQHRQRIANLRENVSTHEAVSLIQRPWTSSWDLGAVECERERAWRRNDGYATSSPWPWPAPPPPPHASFPTSLSPRICEAYCESYGQEKQQRRAHIQRERDNTTHNTTQHTLNTTHNTTQHNTTQATV